MVVRLVQDRYPPAASPIRAPEAKMIQKKEAAFGQLEQGGF